MRAVEDRRGSRSCSSAPVIVGFGPPTGRDVTGVDVGDLVRSVTDCPYVGLAETFKIGFSMCLLRRALFSRAAVVSLGLMAVGSIAAPAAAAAGPVVCGASVTTNLVLGRDLLNCPGDGPRI